MRSTGSLILAAFLFCAGCGGLNVSAKPDADVTFPESSGPMGQTLKKNSRRFAACGKDSVSVQTGTTQHMILAFTVDGKGHVAKADIENMTSPDPDLYDCMVHTVRGIEFPAPAHGQPAHARYPLTLKAE